MNYINFHSLKYIVFLIGCIVPYYLTPVRIRWIVLLIGSVIFYAFAGISKMLFLLIASVVVWYAARQINKVYKKADTEAAEKGLKGKEKVLYLLPYKKKCRNYYLIPALFVVLGMLCYCKFFNLCKTFLSVVLSGSLLDHTVIVPLGISYYTFSSIGYLLDVYWRKQKAVSNYFKFLLCVCYFPQIVQGPIARYHRLIPQFERENHFDFKNVCFGMQLMLYGYFKKMVLADRLVLFTTEVFGNIEKYEGLIFPIALIFSSLQIYMDFSGCMDIVRGTSQIFGIELDENFRHPFFSKSVAEFWRRWHITLGTWFKDYVYLPLASSPRMIQIVGKIKKNCGMEAAKLFSTAVPLAVVWLLTGIWHGTGSNYIVWGCYYGTIIIFSSVLAEHYKKVTAFFRIDTTTIGYQRFQMVRTFFIFTVGRLITVPGTLKATRQVIQRTVSSFNPWIFWDKTLYRMGLEFKEYVVLFFGLWLVWKVSQFQETGSVRERIAQENIVIRWAIYYIAIFTILIFGMYGIGYNPSAFIYAGF